MAIAAFKEKASCLSLEGNIGAGKSTFLAMLEQEFTIQAVFEPHEKWQSVGGTENLLDKFYQSPTRWAYTFQSYAFITRIIEQETYARKSKFPIQILERSIYSDRYCFAKNCFEQGFMNTLEWKLYKEWFSWLTDLSTVMPTAFIYLRTNPDVCYERILKRNRFEESSISLDYLHSIHKKHEQWLIEKNDIDIKLNDVPVLILECNEDFENNNEQWLRHYTQIQNFFKNNLGYQQSLAKKPFLSL